MRMPRWLPFLVTVVFFTVTYLLDIWSTSLFLGSPNCIEANTIFRPFSGSPFILYQLYGMVWFLLVGSSGYLYLLNKRLGGHPILELGYYWLLWASGFQHLTAVQYNLSVLPFCWA